MSILLLLRGDAPQRTVAKLAGLHQSYVSKVERGERELDLALCLAYAQLGRDQVHALQADPDIGRNADYDAAVQLKVDELQRAINAVLFLFDAEMKAVHTSDNP